MGESVTVTGMVLKVMPIGEYDRRVTLLTREQGKVNAFARGARRQNSPLLASTAPFSFGEFELREGRSACSVARASIRNYFRELASDYAATYYGFYFLEFADYCCQENAEEKEMLGLLYQSLRALESPALDNRLVRVVFELRAAYLEGLGPNVFSCQRCGAAKELRFFSVRRGGAFCAACAAGERGGAGFCKLRESTLYAMQFILSSRLEKLYTFAVSEEVLTELCGIVGEYLAVHLGHSFKSLKILEETQNFSGTGHFTG